MQELNFLVSTSSQPDALTLLSNVCFRDQHTAALNLAHIRRLVPPGVYESLAPLLMTSPNPDGAVNQFQRLAESGSPELLRLLDKHLFLVHYAVVVFGYSSWLGETLIRNTDLLRGLARERSLDRIHSREEFQESFARFRLRSFEADAAALLARFKKREYVRIMLRDVLGIATLAETTAELSALSDVLIEEALREVHAQLQHRFGTPQELDREGRLVNSRFAVLSLGKLGGNELNYSSDIDLLYLYDGGIQPEAAEISNREYFIRLAQQTTELLSRHTRDGPVFRIDLRLRPQGNDGEPAVPLPHAVHYYSHVAHDWELQAMIKARHSAGDLALARGFLRAVQPYVYQEDLNFAAIKTALETREKIGSRRRRLLTQPGAGGIDVKIDRGGIRDIEFLVQCLQRVYGGGEPWLRSRGTMFALQKLHDKEHISGKDFHNLTNVYELLRNLEHRLQLRHGQQTHRLPQSRQELQSLARSLTREGTVALTPEEFLSHVQRRMAAVAEIHQRVIYQEQNQPRPDNSQEFELKPELPVTPENSYSSMMQRLAIDSPRLRELAGRPELSQYARRNLERFLSSAGTTSERYGAVLHSPEAVERALDIFEFSEYLTDILVRHPREVLLLEQIRERLPSEAAELFDDAPRSGDAIPDPVFGYLAQDTVDRSEAMCILRQHYRQRVFLSGARDLFQLRRVFESLNDATVAADAAIQAALALTAVPGGFAVIGLGRLGGREFDLLSDADVLFVRDECCNNEEMRRVAERMMEALTSYTRDGTVFPVDARLRPHGREGELIVTPTQLTAYFGKAKPWEALTYLKMRHVAGDSDVADRAVQAVRKGIAQVATWPDFQKELNEVRTRLEHNESGPNFKVGPGGTYDLDYLAGALQARHQLWLAGNLRDRLRLLGEHGLLSTGEFERLEESALFLRTLEHLVRLVTGRARKWLPVAERPRRSVQKLLWRVLGAEDSFDPEMRLAEVLRQTREIYLRYQQA